MDADAFGTAKDLQSLWADLMEERAAIEPRLAVALAGIGDTERDWLSGLPHQGIEPLLSMLEQVVAHRSAMPLLRPAIRRQGRALAQLGMTRARYWTLGYVLGDVFSAILGVAWTASRQAAWTVTWALLANMLANAEAGEPAVRTSGKAASQLPLAS